MKSGKQNVWKLNSDCTIIPEDGLTFVHMGGVVQKQFYLYLEEGIL